MKCAVCHRPRHDGLKCCCAETLRTKQPPNGIQIALAKALKKYGYCRPLCLHATDPRAACTCGFVTALAGATALTETP